MRHLLILVAVAATGAVILPKNEWSLLESLVPSTYFKVILNSEELYNNPKFLNKIAYIALKNMRLFVQTLYARQNYLSRYIACSCPTANLKYEPVIPYFWGLKLGLDTTMNELVQMNKEGLEFSKKMSDIVKTVAVECPLSRQCLYKSNNLFMDILTGKDDSMILESIWQYYLPQFYPKHFEPLYTTDLIVPFQQKCIQFLDMFSTIPFNHFNSRSSGYNLNNLPYHHSFNTFTNLLDYDFSHPDLNEYLYQHPKYLNYRYNMFNKNNPFDLTKECYFSSPSDTYDFYDMAYKPFTRKNSLYDDLDDFKDNNKFSTRNQWHDFDKYPFEFMPYVKSSFDYNFFKNPLGEIMPSPNPMRFIRSPDTSATEEVTSSDEPSKTII